MKKIFFIILMLAVFIYGCTETNSNEKGIYIANGGSNIIGLYDFYNDTLINDFITDIHNMPNRFATDGYYIYVLSSQDAYIDVIDPETNEIINQIELPVGSNPYDMVWANDKLYITLFNEKKVCVIENDTVTAISDTLPSPPEGIDYYDGKLYVCCTGYTPDTLWGHFENGYIAVLNEDLTTDTLIDLGYGTNPQKILFVGSAGYILCTGNYNDVNASIKYIDNYELATWMDNIPSNPGIISYSEGSFYVGGYGMKTYKLQNATIADSFDINNASAMFVYNDSLLFIGTSYWDANTNDSLFIYNLKTKTIDNRIALPQQSGPADLIIIE